jgi:ribonuclease R
MELAFTPSVEFAMTEFAELVLKQVALPTYRPVTAKAMARQLKISGDDYAEFRKSVKRLVKDGKLELAKDKSLRPADRAGLIVGLFRRTTKGFGFVRPHTSNARIDQIYISPEASRDASSGDEVAVKITKRSARRGLNMEGRIVQILERASGVFVGTYFEDGDAGFVKVDGTTFNDPIYVGDPGAKGAKPGDKVAIEIVRYPAPYLEGEGVITEVLGERGQPGVDTLTVIRSFDIPDDFDAAALEESRELAKHFSEAEIGTRLDLRTTPTVTIDPSNARDFDDAISLSRDSRGHWTLGVHIADVSHFVRAGTVLDRTARHRGTSVYLPDRVIPMLPEILSNSLASLQAGHTRYTVSVLLDFDPHGVLTAKQFARSAIQVAHRFTYEQAIDVMKRPEEPHPEVAPSISRLLSDMLELAMILRRRRMARGALELTLPEVEIDLGETGQVIGAHLVEHGESHQVIEEFMLAANEAVALLLAEKDYLFLRRVHPDPEPIKLAGFAEFVQSLGLVLDRPQDRFELQRILKETTGEPEEYAVHYGLLRSLKQARYTPEPEGHYALASGDYCHFTSPIRRYPDLQVHRQLVASLEGKRPKGNEDELFVLGQHCTQTERRAEAAERELIRLKLLTFLENQIGKTFHAIIVGVEDFGLFCRLCELPVEGLIHVTSLSDDYYYLEPETHTLIGRRSGRRHRLGDRELVRIAHVDMDRRQLDLTFADGRTPEPPGTASTSTRTKSSLPKDQSGRARPRAGQGKRVTSNLSPAASARRDGPEKTKKKKAKSKNNGKKRP